MRHDDDRTDEFDDTVVRAAVRDLDDADLDLFVPPPAIWQGIEATVASESARRAPARITSPTTIVEYTIDEHDVVVGVGGQWADFATDNGAAELVAPPVDRTLWSYFDQPDVRALWQMVIGHVRAHHGLARLPFRCDAPEARRWFEMTVEPTSGGRVHFRSELVFEERRLPVAFLDVSVERDPAADPVTVCTWCGRGGTTDGAWLEIDELLRAERLLERSALPPIAWGFCGPCRDDMTAELLVAGGTTDASA